MDDIVIPPIFIVSGSTGSLGEQVVRTVLAQFSDSNVPIQNYPRIRTVEQVSDILDEAVRCHATVVHSMSDPGMRKALADAAAVRNVVAIDLIGPLVDRLSSVLNKEPIGQPGLYFKLHESYFKRIKAINFTIRHDDGKHPEGWSEAEILLAGVSRIGKTPLSMYLSMEGWMVANTPIVPGIPLPELLSIVDSRKLVGLTIDPDQLQQHREQRRRHFGLQDRSEYDDPKKVSDEVEEANRILRKNGFTLIDVTNKPIESTAGKVIDLITRRMSV